jgi:hypothetical protein
MALTLDRMALDDVGANPARLARAIHQQLGEGQGAVPVVEIARALDIVEIRFETLTNFEGALITTPERGYGSILVNQRSNSGRRRFTIGHELLHFLSPVHLPTSPDGFWCGRRDMTVSQVDSMDRHMRQESEANAFAIELLAPLKRIRSYLQGEPDLAAVSSMSDEMDISKEAASRRYVSCHEEILAVVFSRDGRCLYADRSKSFPQLSLRKNAALPELTVGTGVTGLSSIEDAEPDDWIASPDDVHMTLQILRQRAGWSITLLRIVAMDEDEDQGGIDDTYERFTRFGG